jgi:predicted NBD/HSP70 family sugar kinase
MTIADGTAPRVPWPELAAAERAVLLELLLHGARSRIRLAERVGLSRASLTRIARELVDLGLVAEGEVELTNARGRPGEQLYLRPEAAHFLGIKLTGDTLYAVVTDLSARVVHSESHPLESKDVDHVVRLIGAVASDLLSDRALPAAIGVGLAGDVLKRDGTQILERSAFLGWSGSTPLRSLVEAETGIPTTVTNDVHALTAAHHWFGSGVGLDSLVVYGLGAGIGSGVVIGDELMEGAHGRSGRIGHSRVGGVGRECENGHVDCVHSFVTMPAIEYNSGVEAGAYALAVERASHGDERALEAFSRAAYALGAVVAESVNSFDPEMLSIMGEGLDMLDFAPASFRSGVAEYLEQVDPESLRIERPAFDFGLYARGAAVAAMRELLS